MRTTEITFYVDVRVSLQAQDINADTNVITLLSVQGQTPASQEIGKFLKQTLAGSSYTDGAFCPHVIFEHFSKGTLKVLWVIVL